MRSLYGDRHNGKQEIERAIKRLNEVGLLSHLTEGEVVERCQTIQEENLSVDRLVYQFHSSHIGLTQSTCGIRQYPHRMKHLSAT